MTSIAGRTLFVVTALLLTLAARAHAQGERLSLYGFFDLELAAANRQGGPQWTFDQHHFNVISVYRLDPRWRVFAEIEWEHGPSIGSEGVAGEVLLERATVEYKRSDAFQVKAGKFLPPFGLYNVRHDATPTFLSTSLPSLYADHPNPLGADQALLPEFGTGVQVLGSVFSAAGWQGEYFVYGINGRGPDAAGQDNNADKGIGGRVVLHLPADVLQLGASYYGDRNGDAGNTRQRSLGLDATLRYGEFLMETELLVPRLERVDGAGRPGGSFRTGRSFYVQLSHPLSGRLTPFARYDVYDPDTSAGQDREHDVVAGINFAATGAVFFKGEMHFRSFQEPARDDFRAFLGSVAVAF